jgi:hypothetical protein
MAIILFLVYKQKILRPGRYGKLIYTKAKWILGTYGLILLVSVIVLYCIPNKNFLPFKSNDEMNNNQTYSQDIVKAALVHEIDKTEGIYTVKKWSFDFPGKQLDLRSSILRNSNLKIIAERKLKNDNKVDIIEYSTKVFFNNIDFTMSVKSPEIKLVGMDLKIVEAENYTINLSSFKKEFTSTQFMGYSSNQQTNRIDLTWGSRILYIRIPKDMKLLDSYLNIQYISESN